MAYTERFRDLSLYYLGAFKVAIFDCCHSETRTHEVEPNYVARHFLDPSTLPAIIDQDIIYRGIRSAMPYIPPSFRDQIMDSYVLLTACRQDEFAYEVTTSGVTRGAFSSALIQRLNEIHLARYTYAQLIEGLPKLRNQTPQCEGNNRTLSVFNLSMPIHEVHLTFSILNVAGQRFQVNAGGAHGIVQGTEFTVFGDNCVSIDERSVGTFVADIVGNATCSLTPPLMDTFFDIPRVSHARVSNWNDPDFSFKVFWELLHPTNNLADRAPTQFHHTDPAIIIVDDSSNADILVLPDDAGAVDFHRMDPLIREYAKISPRHKISSDRVANVLDAAAHFNHHLYRYKRPHPSLLKGQVEIELLRLETLSDHGSVMYRPVDDGNLFSEGYAKVLYDRQAVYGFKVVNNSNYDLFPYLFYFDPADYSIQVCTMPFQKSPTCDTHPCVVNSRSFICLHPKKWSPHFDQNIFSQLVTA
jgi:hypothetical protein